MNAERRADEERRRAGDVVDRVADERGRPNLAVEDVDDRPSPGRSRRDGPDSVQSVRLIGLPRPTAGMWSSRLGPADLWPAPWPGVVDLGEVGRVGPGGDGHDARWPGRRGRRRPSTASGQIIARPRISERRQAVEAEEGDHQPVGQPPRPGRSPTRDAPSETISM